MTYDAHPQSASVTVVPSAVSLTRNFPAHNAHLHSGSLSVAHFSRSRALRFTVTVMYARLGPAHIHHHTSRCPWPHLP